MKKSLIIFVIIWVVFSILAIAFNQGNKIPESIAQGLGIAFLIFLYFLPSIVAEINKHRQFQAISTLNLLLGWTLIGWIIALIWSLTKPSVSVS